MKSRSLHAAQAVQHKTDSSSTVQGCKGKYEPGAAMRSKQRGAWWEKRRQRSSPEQAPVRPGSSLSR